MKTLIHAMAMKPVQIESLVGSPVLTKRLREMGFHSGCEIRLLGRAPFKGPFVVQLHDSVLALRYAEAECLVIK